MNRDQLKGVWGQVKGKAKIIWGELLEDDDARAEGSVDKLYGRLQKRFGDTKEKLKRHLDRVRMP